MKSLKLRSIVFVTTSLIFWTAGRTVAQDSSAPVITSPERIAGAVGIPFSYAITATNDPTHYGAVGLPKGLSLDAKTGLISGAPASSGLFRVSLSATHGKGTGSLMLMLFVNRPPVSMIISPRRAEGFVGNPFEYQIKATDNPTRFDARGLPSGLTLNKTTGLISGTPAAPGISRVILSATNTHGTANDALTLKITTTTVTNPAVAN